MSVTHPAPSAHRLRAVPFTVLLALALLAVLVTPGASVPAGCLAAAALAHRLLARHHVHRVRLSRRAAVVPVPAAEAPAGTG